MTRQIPFLESVRHDGRLCFAEATRAANRALTRFYNQRLEGTDINIAQFSLLVRLYYLPDASVNKLARVMETERSTLSRNLKVLDRAGLVQMGSTEDRRVRSARLTEAGMETLEQALPMWQQAQQDLRDRIGAEQWTLLFAGLGSLAKLPGASEDRAG